MAVSQRVDSYPNRAEVRDSLDQNLVEFLAAAGCLAVPVPNALSEIPGALLEWLRASAPAAFVLSGGNDIGERPERDLTERLMLDYAERLERPVLGVCRGMQMLAYRAGTGLKAVEGHVRTRHSLTGLVTGEVNSFHNLNLAGCPAGFEVLACSDDGEIEAIKHKSLPWEGWMWHPERESPFRSADLLRMRDLLDA